MAKLMIILSLVFNVSISFAGEVQLKTSSTITESIAFSGIQKVSTGGDKTYNVRFIGNSGDRTYIYEMDSYADASALAKDAVQRSTKIECWPDRFERNSEDHRIIYCHFNYLIAD